MASLSIALRNDIREVARLAAMTERFGADHRLSPDDVMRINLVLDEIVGNVIRHGQAGPAGRIDVTVSLQGAAITIDVIDDGIAFDPLTVPPPNLDLPIEERPVGGLGIHIVKSLAAGVEYRREGDRNHLVVTIARMKEEGPTGPS